MDRTNDLLVERLKAGDREAAAELVDIYYEHIYLFLRRLGHNRQASEDLTQETFLHAWQHIGQLRSGGALSGWIYRIASNVARHHWRRDGDDQCVLLPRGDLIQSAETAGPGRLEDIERLKRALDTLPMNLKQPVVLHYMQNLTIAEAALAMDTREGTVKSRLNRALKVLKVKMTRTEENQL